jgi:predicted acetyltransferase
MLTASEATIYGRYGFAPAAMSADLEVVTRRATWTGPVASGRVHFVTREQLRDGCRDVFDRARVQTPGDVALDDHIWQGLLGLVGEETSQSKHLRAVRYDDADGRAQGFAVYRVAEGGDGDFGNHTATVRHLVAATDDAYAGLWRFLLELDLVGTVVAPLRSVDEPLPWQVADHRAVRRTRISDHLWLRVLDVPAALAARSYSAPARLVLDVRDPLGLAHGRFLVEIDTHGAAEVRRVDADAAPHAATLALSVNELGALYLGGTSARTLVRAGRVAELTEGAADVVDASFRSTVTPWLSTWF